MSARTVLVALLLSFGSKAFAGDSSVSARTEQSTPLTISARLGLGGLHRVGDWMPVAVSLKNDGPPVDLVVGVPLDPQPGVWTHVTLPSHSQKRLFLYVPLRGRDFLARLEDEAMNRNRNPLLRVEAHAGRTLVKLITFPYQPTERSTYAVGLVGDEALPRSYFANRGVLISEAGQTMAPPAPPASTILIPAPLLPARPRTPQPTLLLQPGVLRLEPIRRNPTKFRYVWKAKTVPGSRLVPARRSPTWPPSLFGAAAYRKLECACYQLAVDDLPEAAAGLESLDCLAMTPATLAKLSSAQREAVLRWIEQGGGMLLFGGTVAEVNAASVSPLCPVRAVGTHVVERVPSLAPWALEFRRREGLAAQALSAGGSFGMIPGDEPQRSPIPSLARRFLLNRVTPMKGAHVDLSEEGGALLVTQSRGYGGIAYCSLPLTSEQIRQWPGAPDLWLRALSVLVERFQRTRGSDVGVRAVSPPHFTSSNLGDDPAVSGFLRKLRGVKPPPKWGVGVIAILYVLIFGPVNVWLVRRVRRSERGWLTTPALSAGFALFLLLCGFQWGSGTSVLTQFSLLECRAGATTAREETVFSIFSPVHGRYNFAFNDPCVFVDDKTAEEEDRVSVTTIARTGFRLRASTLVAEQFAPSLDAAQWEQTSRATAWRGAPIGVWTLRRLRTTRAVALGGSVDLECKRGANGAVSECLVSNNTPLTLRDGLLVAGRAHGNLGELAPGATRRLTADRWIVLQPGMVDYSNFAPGLDASLRELIHQLSITLMSHAGGVTLFARHDAPLLRIETADGTVHRAYGLLVVHAPAPQ